MSTEIKYRGKEADILKIMDCLKTKLIRKNGRAIIIPTEYGAKEFYVGDTIIFDGENVFLKELKK